MARQRLRTWSSSAIRRALVSVCMYGNVGDSKLRMATRQEARRTSQPSGCRCSKRLFAADKTQEKVMRTTQQAVYNIVYNESLPSIPTCAFHPTPFFPTLQVGASSIFCLPPLQVPSTPPLDLKHGPATQGPCRARGCLGRAVGRISLGVAPCVPDSARRQQGPGHYLRYVCRFPP